MIQDSWINGNEFDDPFEDEEEEIRTPNPNAVKQLFTLTLEAEDMYDEGPWDINQIITAIESCESGLKVLDVSEVMPSMRTTDEHVYHPVNQIEERPPRRSRT